MYFKAWYVNQVTYVGASVEDLFQLPDDGFLGIFFVSDAGRARVASGYDMYGLYGDTFIHNNDDLATNERRYPGVRWIRGQWTSDADNERVIEEMRQEMIAHG